MDMNSDNDIDSAGGLSSGMVMDAPKARAMRPIKISNHDLLDEESQFTVLKKDLVQNDQFILLPKGAWQQLHEWYGGGPAIERFVVCTDKEMRMKVLKFTLDKLNYDYQEEERLMKEAIKKKKGKQKDKKDKKKDKDDDSESETNDNNDKKSTKKGEFNPDKFEKEYKAFLMEQSFMVNPETMRVDLYPVYIYFMPTNEKGQILSDRQREFAISRYTTLPELYISVCARLGYGIEDLSKIKENYKKYLQYKLDEKANERNNKDEKDKKGKKKDDKKSKKDYPKIDLPPRIFQVIQQRGASNRLLFPIPKIKKPESDQDKDKDQDKDTDKNNQDTQPKVKAESDADNNKDKDEANPTDEKPKDEANDGDATTNDTDKDKDKENEGNDTNEDKDKVDKPEATAANGASSATDDKDKDKVSEGNETTDNETDDTSAEDELEELDLAALEIQSGLMIAVEFPYPNKKKGNALEYKLKSQQEDEVCEPDIDDSWLDFEEGDELDGRDRWGKWYKAQIKKHKKANEPLPKKTKLNKAQEKNIKELEKLEAIFIHYVAWEEKWDEWIFIKPDETICRCKSVCQSEKGKHRLAAPNTQSKFREQNKPRYSGNRYSRSGNSYDRWGGRGRESVRGTPSTAGCVGLANLGNTCFMNSILQCVSNTPHFRTFFTSGQYKQDINKQNPLGMKGELANEFAKLVTDVWSGEYKVIAPRSLKRSLSKFAPQFSGWQQHDSQEFLAFLLDGLHEDLNLIKSKPYTEKIESKGRPDSEVADLSWKIYLQRNKSKIVDIFQAQQKSHVICPECTRNSITFDTYMYLSVPIVGSTTKSLIVDIFHRLDDKPINKPIRHVYHVNKYQKVRDLAKMVANTYNTKPQFVLFYENWNMKVAREYEHNLSLGMVPNREALACYILKNWNDEVTPQDIKKKKLSLQLAKLCHAQPLNNGKGLTRGSSGPLFGMPFVVSFLNIHTRREVHQVIYERLHTWVGDEVLKPPPKIQKLKKVKKEKPESNETPKDDDTSENKDKEKDTDDGKKKKDKKKDKKKKKKGKKDDSSDDDEEEKEDEYDYIRPSAEELEAWEAEWDKVFEDIPYKLRLIPYRHYSFYSSKGIPEEIPIDDVPFEKGIRTKDIEIIIEWKAESHEAIKQVVNKVVVDGDYSKWKKEKQAKASRDDQQLTLYDCINAYVAQETLGENDLWYCSECKKHQKANKKLDLWSFPEILVIHLKRFQVLGVGRFGRGEKIQTFVDCPVRGLDLTDYVINGADTGTAPIYDLYAVSCHSGSCGGGHYTAYALNDETDRWYYFNDSSVRPAKQSDIISGSTYVLFYKKCR